MTPLHDYLNYQEIMLAKRLAEKRHGGTLPKRHGRKFHHLCMMQNGRGNTSRHNYRIACMAVLNLIAPIA